MSPQRAEGEGGGVGPRTRPRPASRPDAAGGRPLPATTLFFPLKGSTTFGKPGARPEAGAPRDGTARARSGGPCGRRPPPSRAPPDPRHPTRRPFPRRPPLNPNPFPSPRAPACERACAHVKGAGGGAHPHGTYGTIAAGEVQSEEMWGGDGAGGDARESPRVAGGACHRPAKVPRAVSHKSDPAQAGLAVWREGSRRTVSGWARGGGAGERPG